MLSRDCMYYFHILFVYNVVIVINDESSHEPTSIISGDEDGMRFKGEKCAFLQK